MIPLDPFPQSLWSGSHAVSHPAVGKRGPFLLSARFLDFAACLLKMPSRSLVCFPNQGLHIHILMVAVSLVGGFTFS